MFTGIVEATGTISQVEERDGTRRFRLEAPAFAVELAPGDSVSVDGACMTVVARDDEGFEVDVIGTTLARTVAGSYGEGTAVNLERAMVLGDRIDGHLVQGHVDGVGRLIHREKDGDYWLFDFELPSDIAAQTVPRGSVCLNGVSLTVADIREDDVVRVGLIPYTHDHTNLGALQPEDPVNVEGDLIGKYVERLMAARAEP